MQLQVVLVNSAASALLFWDRGGGGGGLTAAGRGHLELLVLLLLELLKLLGFGLKLLHALLELQQLGLLVLEGGRGMKVGGGDCWSGCDDGASSHGTRVVTSSAQQTRPDSGVCTPSYKGLRAGCREWGTHSVRCWGSLVLVGVVQVIVLEVLEDLLIVVRHDGYVRWYCIRQAKTHA